MRKLFGWCVLIFGVAGLGYIGVMPTATGIQDRLGQDAARVAQSAQHSITTTLSGRDVKVSGTVLDQDEADRLRAAFEGIFGVRMVDMGRVEPLPVVEPYELRLSKPVEGPAELLGVVQTQDAHDALRAAVTGNVDMNVTFASGMPRPDWIDVATSVLPLLDQLEWGEVVLSDTQVTVGGHALTPDEIAAIDVALAALPEGYTSRVNISVEDDGTPLRLDLSLQDSRVEGAGKLPSDLQWGDVAEQFGSVVDVQITQATIPAADPAWPLAAVTSIETLGYLRDGRLRMNGQTIFLIGRADPDGKQQAEAAMDDLPEGYSATVEIALWDDGAPLRMTMTWDGSVAAARGKFPDGFSPRGPAGVAVDNDAMFSFLPDTSGVFTTNANAGVAALGLMNAGTLEVTAEAIRLTGTATSPQVGIVMDRVLASVADDAVVTRDITYLDDGSPAAWTLRYDAATGAQIEGRLPVGLAVDDIARSLNLPDIAGTPSIAREDEEVGNSLVTLSMTAPYLTDVEALTYTRDGDSSALDLIVSPGVDLDLVAIDLSERLPVDVAFSLAPLETQPADGSVRRNMASGEQEVFRDGYWLPVLEFTPDVAGCGAQSDAVLERAKITFLPGSARLDATSIRAINGLAAVARPCVAAGLTVEIGGHTDDTGDALANEVLSFERASAVLDALSARGVEMQSMSAFGFGPSQPIADNATEVGRAANRRTTLLWATP